MVRAFRMEPKRHNILHPDAAIGTVTALNTEMPDNPRSKQPQLLEWYCL